MRRIGTAEIYNVVEQLPEVAEAVAIGPAKLAEHAKTLLEGKDISLTTIGRSARHSAAAADLVRRQATADLGDCLHGETLALATLRELSRVRARAVLRHWVLARGLPPPDSRHTERLLDELTPADGAGGAAAATVERLRARLHELEARMGRRPKLLVGKPGLDGHSNGAEQIAVTENATYATHTVGTWTYRIRTASS